MDSGAAGRRRGGKTRRSAAPCAVESLYADLLSENSAGNIQKAAVASATEAAEAEDYADVFGGPPKFASLSSQFSFKRGIARVSDASTKGAPAFRAFAAAAPTDCSSAFDILDGRFGPLSSFSTAQEVLGTCGYSEARTPTFFAVVPDSANSAKLRSAAEVKPSSRACYSDSDNKTFTKHKEEAAFRRDEISGMLPQVPAAAVKTASTILGRKEVTKSDGGEDAKDIPVVKPVRRGLAMMKENVQVSSNVFMAEQVGSHGGAHARTASSSRRYQDATQKCTRSAFDMKAEGQRLNLKATKKGDVDEFWITIKDFKFATEPSRFPPPSRPPPGLGSDSVYDLKNTAEAMKQVDDWSGKSRQTLWEESNSASGFVFFSSIQESDKRDAVASEAVRDAMEMAEAKIRMVIEAREKAKLIVEKKLREKRRDRQEKRLNDMKGNVEIEKELVRDSRVEHEKSSVRCFEDKTKRNETERERRRDIARQRVERATREVREKAAAMIQERAGTVAGELRATQDASEGSVEDETHKFSARSASYKEATEARPEAGHFSFEKKNTEVHRRCACDAEKGPEKAVVEEDIFVTREQQQARFCTPRQSHAAMARHAAPPCDSLSNSCCNSQWRNFTEAASLQRVSSLTSSHNDLASPSGGTFGNISFQEIVGETLERRKARWDRHCRITARMAKVLEEKKQRDLQSQSEQMERHRAGEMLDEEIKSWAAGKEGNLQALLCSLQYVLWPECGWQPMLPADLSTAAAVKKAYRKATLCVHPDKVQQKGATIAQKYIAEKVFDLLKEASVKTM